MIVGNVKNDEHHGFMPVLSWHCHTGVFSVIHRSFANMMLEYLQTGLKKDAPLSRGVISDLHSTVSCYFFFLSSTAA
jgi:hypothetical protein